jgi:HEAT repeat protein
MGILSDLFRPNIEKLKKRSDVERLIRALQHRDWHIRMDAVEALGMLGDERGVPALIESLKDESKHVRREAAIALGTLGDKRAIEPLIHALKSEWDDSETPFIEAIERLGERTSIQPLIKAYKYRSKWVRGEEDESLGKIQDVIRTEPAVTVLRDEEKTLEWESELLQRIGDAREIEPIIEALNYETALSRWRESFIRGRLERGELPEDSMPPKLPDPQDEESPEENSLKFIKKKAMK